MWMERRTTEVTKLIVAFCNLVNGNYRGQEHDITMDHMNAGYENKTWIDMV